MVLHTCQRCGKEFDHKSNLVNHLSRKKQCQPLLLDIERDAQLLQLKRNILPTFKCELCSASFTSQYAKRYHMEKNVCTKNTSNHTVNNTIVNNNTIINNNTIVNNNTVNNSINNNFVNVTLATGLRDFGKERLDHITPEMIRGFLVNIYDGIPQLIDAIHFGEVPENRNICVHSTTQKTIKLVKNGQWVIVPNFEAMRVSTETCRKVLDQHLKDNIDLLRAIIASDPDPATRSDAQRELNTTLLNDEWVSRNMSPKFVDHTTDVTFGRDYKKTCAMISSHILTRSRPPTAHVHVPVLTTKATKPTR
jgi:hypothetical protein